jgi:hypothetical protein
MSSILLIMVINYFFISPPKIQVDEFTFRDNGLGSSNRASVRPEISSDILECIGERFYFRQRLIDSWSTSEINYELNFYSNNEDALIRYRILINDNETSETRLAYRSRVDVIVYSEYFWKRSSYSLDLNDEQIAEIIRYIEKIDTQVNI